MARHQLRSTAMPEQDPLASMLREHPQGMTIKLIMDEHSRGGNAALINSIGAGIPAIVDAFPGTSGLPVLSQVLGLVTEGAIHPGALTPERITPKTDYTQPMPEREEGQEAQLTGAKYIQHLIAGGVQETAMDRGFSKAQEGFRKKQEKFFNRRNDPGLV